METSKPSTGLSLYSSAAEKRETGNLVGLGRSGWKASTQFGLGQVPTG